MAKQLERRDQCCLCGKTKEQVRKLIVGLHGAVCSDCIDLCCDILGHEAKSAPAVSDLEAGYSLDVVPPVSTAFPDPRELTEILVRLARSVNNRVLQHLRHLEEDARTDPPPSASEPG